LNEINDVEVVYDEDRIQQVIVNLLSNAFKFSNEENGEVKISTYVNQNKVEISVEDNGKGIENDELTAIFNKFYQSKNQTLLKPIGSGLGLAISKQIIESHNGKIWAENSIPQGARLTFTLPLNIK
jgi:signal transduction histidine kinase